MSHPAPTDYSSSPLFDGVSLGAIDLPNRIVMAPLTRVRAGSEGVPNDLMGEYYRQRASAGLIITEGTYPDHASQGWIGAPGIANDEQATGWKKVFDAVHTAGGRVVVQLMHAGRATHPALNGGGRILAPSAIPIDGMVFTGAGEEPYPQPEAMTTQDMKEVISSFVRAAERAIASGADGVEIHGANGYLLHQFHSHASNHRTDRFGGSPENRARFTLAVTSAVADAVGADRVGIRLSPEVGLGGVVEDDRADVLDTYGVLVDGLSSLGLAYLSILHADPGSGFIQDLRRRFDGPVIVNSGAPGGQTTRDEAHERIAVGHADAVAVGRALIANPDLVARWREGHPENEPRYELFYADTAEGYTDYPTHDETSIVVH